MTATAVKPRELKPTDTIDVLVPGDVVRMCDDADLIEGFATILHLGRDASGRHIICHRDAESRQIFVEKVKVGSHSYVDESRGTLNYGCHPGDVRWKSFAPGSRKYEELNQKLAEKGL